MKMIQPKIILMRGHLVMYQILTSCWVLGAQKLVEIFKNAITHQEFAGIITKFNKKEKTCLLLVF